MHRKYEGHGTISFVTDNQFECNFELNYYDSGRITLTCHLPLSTQYLTILENEATKDEKIVLEASFKGVTPDGGNIAIEKMGLDRTTAHPDRVGSNIFYDGRNLRITDWILSVSGKGLFIFVVISNVEIDYSLLKENETVISNWYLVNFHFAGNERSTERLPNWDKFSVNSDGLNLQLIQSIGYHQIIEELIQTGKNDITTDAEVVAKFREIPAVYDKLIQLCWILSFATSNWVMPLFNDIFLQSKMGHSTLYPRMLAYPFMKEKHVVEMYDSNFLIEDFAKKALENYNTMKDDFGLSAILEYYLAAIRQKTPEAEFLMGMIAFECLSSYVPKYAAKKNEQLVSKDVESKKKAITKVDRSLDLRLSDNQIEEIAKEVAYSSIGLKDSLRYIFQKFDVHCRNDDLNALVSIRGALVHSGKYHDFEELMNKIDILFQLAYHNHSKYAWMARRRSKTFILTRVPDHNKAGFGFDRKRTYWL
ncbi:MAG: hypothetical protein ACR2IS_15230 [Nitrososphaeraceae archaeon]